VHVRSSAPLTIAADIHSVGLLLLLLLLVAVLPLWLQLALVDKQHRGLTPLRSASPGDQGE